MPINLDTETAKGNDNEGGKGVTSNAAIKKLISSAPSDSILQIWVLIE